MSSSKHSVTKGYYEQGLDRLSLEGLWRNWQRIRLQIGRLGVRFSQASLFLFGSINPLLKNKINRQKGLILIKSLFAFTQHTANLLIQILTFACVLNDAFFCPSIPSYDISESSCSLKLRDEDPFIEDVALARIYLVCPLFETTPY